MIVKTSPDEIQSFLVDASNYKGHCDAVYFPETRNDVVEILKEANRKRTLVTIAGNGTGLAGARVPEGGIVISTGKMNRVIDINRNELTATVEPGVILSTFLEEVKKSGLLYPPDPTEKNCFIGGTVATNASGEKTFKYGPTRNYVIALEVVLPDGEILDLERGKTFASGNQLVLNTYTGKAINVTLPEINLPH